MRDTQPKATEKPSVFNGKKPTNLSNGRYKVDKYGNVKEYDSKGNVISREPKSIQDQMVQDAAYKGAGKKLDIDIKDPKFPNHDKWEYSEKSSEGVTSTVHYMKDRDTGEISDMKFMNHGLKDGDTRTIGRYEKSPKEQGGIVDKKKKKKDK